MEGQKGSKRTPSVAWRKSSDQEKRRVAWKHTLGFFLLGLMVMAGGKGSRARNQPNHGSNTKGRLLNRGGSIREMGRKERTWRSGRRMQEDDLCGEILHQVDDKCQHVMDNCLGEQEGLMDYLKFYYCDMHGKQPLAIVVISLIALVSLYVLATTADNFFCPTLTDLSHRMGLSPNLTGAILLPIGVGAADLFTYFVAFSEGETAISFGAVFGATSFVTALVMGCVVLIAGPTQVAPHNFVRNAGTLVLSALLALMLLLLGKIYVWNAFVNISVYICFVSVALFMSRGQALQHEQDSDLDQESSINKEAEAKPLLNGPKRERDIRNGHEEEAAPATEEEHVEEIDDVDESILYQKEWEAFSPEEPSLGIAASFYARKWQKEFGEQRALGKLLTVVFFPIEIVRRMTIPSPEITHWNKIFGTLNLIFSPVVALSLIGELVPLDAPLLVIGPTSIPLIAGLLLQTTVAASLLFKKMSYKHLPTFQWYLSVIGFWCCIRWLSMAAEEVMFCLASLGTIAAIPGQFLGATVIAWGNSIGDFVANVALAKNGDAQIALAACFASPAFNLLIGLGLPMLKTTVSTFPNPILLDPEKTVLVSGGITIGTIAIIFCAVVFSGFQFTRTVAIFGIVAFGIQTVVNVALTL